MTAAERIYIGGLDPPRLKASDVIQRLKVLDIEILEPTFPNSVGAGSDVVDSDTDNDDDGGVNSKCFFHLMAISKQDEVSALDLIAKTYHNVKWKGCKLIVQAARPNFLERLVEERQQYQELLMNRKDGESHPENATTTTMSDMIPRRLRIRKRHGEEAYHVDTKPCDVDDWSQFSRALEKIKKRREKSFPTVVGKKLQFSRGPATDSVTATSSKATAFLNRAVHIRFEHKKKSKKNSTVVTDGKDDVQDKDSLEAKHGTRRTGVSSSHSSSSSSSSVDSDDSAEASPGRILVAGVESSAYTWSDDDDYGDSITKEERSSTSDEDEVDIRGHQGSQQITIVEKDDEDEASVSSEESDTGAPFADETFSKRDYEWSSDDDEIDEALNSSDRPSKGKTTQSFRSVALNDEFTAGIEDDEGDDGSSENMETEDGLAVIKNLDQYEGMGLDQDVEVNLNILSSIFPDVANAKAALQHPDNDDSTASRKDINGKEQRQMSNQTGWGNNGLMLRYDPSKESAQKFVIDTSAAAQEGSDKDGSDEGSNVQGNTKDEGEDDENSSGSESSSVSENQNKADSPVTTSESLAKSVPEERLYEQGKLEDVFRQARDAWQTPQIQQMAGIEDKIAGLSKSTDTAGSFAFGFDLGLAQPTGSQADAPAPKTPSQSGGFGFSFDLEDNALISTRIEESNSDPIDPTGETSMEIPFANNDHDKAAIVPMVRRRHFPDKVLDSYVSLFFSMNDGKRMAEDPEGFDRDESVKEQWNKERQALTLDWKRKRKHAVVRLQKRKKFR
jgi:hypothetical protein